MLKVLNLQKTYGRDAEVSVELDDLWIDRLKQYDLSGPIEFESSWAAPTVNGGASQESSGGQSVDRQESDVSFPANP